MNGEVSPDGRFLAYQSNESGHLEVYVRPYPLVASGHWQVPTTGGLMPAWTHSGRGLVYLDGAHRLTVVPVETTPTFSAGVPTTRLTAVYYARSGYRSYDISSDGQRFLMIKEGANGTETAPSSTLVVVQNFLEELRRLLPPVK